MHSYCSFGSALLHNLHYYIFILINLIFTLIYRTKVNLLSSVSSSGSLGRSSFSYLHPEARSPITSSLPGVLPSHTSYIINLSTFSSSTDETNSVCGFPGKILTKYTVHTWLFAKLTVWSSSMSKLELCFKMWYSYITSL